MPELAEVEVIRRQIGEHIEGKKVVACTALLPRMIRNSSLEELKKLTEQQVVTSLRRRGKYLVFTFGNNAVMLLHLRMTGRLLFIEPNEVNVEKYPRISFAFEDGSTLIFGDTRTLGGVYVYSEEKAVDNTGYLTLGVEPLSSQFTASMCYNLTRKSKKPIKTFLLDQRYIAGLGNIYADEALFLSGIHPKRQTSSITKEEATKLHHSIQNVLKESIHNGGTSFRDYRNGEGKRGSNQNHLFVYGRKGKECRHCGKILLSDNIGGRTTVFCNNCQI